jgi:hypothetical protein
MSLTYRSKLISVFKTYGSHYSCTSNGTPHSNIIKKNLQFKCILYHTYVLLKSEHKTDFQMILQEQKHDKNWA